MNSSMLRGARLALAAGLLIGAANGQFTELVSKSVVGAPGNGDCTNNVALSGDGRFVGFASRATNLLPGVTQPGHGYLRDRQAQTLELLTVTSGGPGLMAEAAIGGVSDDGRFVAFRADGLVDFDFGSNDIYVRDRVAGTTVELSPFEFQGLQRSVPQISADGQRVAWLELNNWFPPFVTTEIVVKTPAGVPVASVLAQAQGLPSDEIVSDPVLSGDGTALVYSRRTPLGVSVMYRNISTPGSTPIQVASAPNSSGSVVAYGVVSPNGRYVAYTRGFGGVSFEGWLYDVTTGSLERVDPPLAGGLQWDSMMSSVSSDGRFVAFSSFASNLVSGDGNNWVDAFVRDRSLQQTFRISVSPAGAGANFHTERLVLSRSGSVAALVTRANNLAPGDTNSRSDVFVRSLTVFTDADGDGWGVGAPVLSAALPAAGQASRAGDCNDADPAVNPGRPEVCNGIDDDCSSGIDDNVGLAYCSAGLSSDGCVAQLGSSGCPSASQTSGYSLNLSGVSGGRNVIWFYGVAPTAAPFGAWSTLCVALPFQRLPIVPSTGAPGSCNGSASIDLLSWAAQAPALLVPWTAGQSLYFQAGVRDPGAAIGSALSGGFAFELTP